MNEMNEYISIKLSCAIQRRNSTSQDGDVTTNLTLRLPTHIVSTSPARLSIRICSGGYDYVPSINADGISTYQLTDDSSSRWCRH